MSELFLYDDVRARRFEPFALTRPVCELRAGALLLRERWEYALGLRCAGIVSRTELSDFEESWAPPVMSGRLPAGSILASSRCAVRLAPLPTADVWRCGDRVCAVLLSRDVEIAELGEGGMEPEFFSRDSGRAASVDGWWVDDVWDFIRHLPDQLIADVPALGVSAPRLTPDRAILLGKHPVYAEDGATIEPQVCFDVTAGPILIRRGATVQAFTRIAGPTVVGVESTVGGDKITGCSIGDVCKVHGEVSTTIFLGHANKGHDGFIGHSYLGRWVNLGAGTITSNLKNTYGQVQLWTPDGVRDTGLQFLGTLFGDHAKTGIGTTLTTGTVLGAGANVFGSTMPPKAVPPFAWGEHPPYKTYQLDKFLEVARRMMSRRHVQLSEQQSKLLAAAFEHRWTVDRET